MTELYEQMNREMHQRMRADGVDIGALVELELKDKVVFNLQTTTVPTYHGELPNCECAKPGRRTCAGYVVQFDKKRVGIAPVWNHDLKRIAEQGYVGGVNIDPAAVENYRVLSRK
jgi:hypothetical protein